MGSTVWSPTRILGFLAASDSTPRTGTSRAGSMPRKTLAGERIRHRLSDLDPTEVASPSQRNDHGQLIESQWKTEGEQHEDECEAVKCDNRIGYAATHVEMLFRSTGAPTRKHLPKEASLGFKVKLHSSNSGVLV